MTPISFSSTYFGWISWFVVSPCCLIAEKHSGRVPGLCSFPREFHERLDSPTYVNSQDLHLTLYKIPFFCQLLGRSLGFLKICPRFLMGLNAVLMLTLFNLKLAGEEGGGGRCTPLGVFGLRFLSLDQLPNAFSQLFLDNEDIF